MCHSILTSARTPRRRLCHSILTTTTTTPRFGLCHNTLSPERTTPTLGLSHNTMTPAATPKPGLCHNTFTQPARTPRIGLRRNTLTPARTPCLGLCRYTLIPAKNTKAPLKLCYILHSDVGTTVHHWRELVQVRFLSRVSRHKYLLVATKKDVFSWSKHVSVATNILSLWCLLPWCCCWCQYAVTQPKPNIFCRDKIRCCFSCCFFFLVFFSRFFLSQQTRVCRDKSSNCGIYRQ